MAIYEFQRMLTLLRYAKLIFFVKDFIVRKY